MIDNTTPQFADALTDDREARFDPARDQDPARIRANQLAIAVVDARAAIVTELDSPLYRDAPSVEPAVADTTPYNQSPDASFPNLAASADDVPAVTAAGTETEAVDPDATPSAAARLEAARSNVAAGFDTPGTTVDSNTYLEGLEG